MGRKVLEEIKVATGDVSGDLGAESSPADSIATVAYLKLDKFGKYVAMGCVQGCASDSIITLTIYQATAAAGTNSKTITTTITDTATSTHLTELLTVTAEVDASELDHASSFYWAGARVTTNAGAGTEIAGLISFRTDGRFDPQSN